MGAAFTGFATIWVVVGVGWLLAQLDLVTSADQRFLSNVSFLVAMPALLFTLVSSGSLTHLFARTLAVSVIAIAVSGGIYLILARTVFRPSIGESVIGFMSSCYTNAGNLGLPIAAHLLGDMAWMAPILLVQVGVIQPVCLAVLDMEKARKGQGTLSVTKYLTLPIRNPITVGIVLGLIMNITGARLPAFVTSPVGMVGNMAVPMMLIMLGVSLRLDPRPGRGRHAKQVWAIQVLKVVVHPLAAYTVGRFGFGLDAADLFAVTVIAALPTAQNVFVLSSRYRVGEALARDSVFWSTLLTVGSIFCIAVLLPS